MIPKNKDSLRELKKKCRNNQKISLALRTPVLVATPISAPKPSYATTLLFITLSLGIISISVGFVPIIKAELVVVVCWSILCFIPERKTRNVSFVEESSEPGEHCETMNNRTLKLRTTRRSLLSSPKLKIKLGRFYVDSEAKC